MKPENFRANNQRPFTHKEYLDSLQDGREIYIYGERVKKRYHSSGFSQCCGVHWPAI